MHDCAAGGYEGIGFGWKAEREGGEVGKGVCGGDGGEVADDGWGRSLVEDPE